MQAVLKHGAGLVHMKYSVTGLDTSPCTLSHWLSAGSAADGHVLLLEFVLLLLQLIKFGVALTVDR